MKNFLLNVLSLFLRIYASAFLIINLLILPPTIWLNQSIAFTLSSPLFMSSILKQNVLDALNIVIFDSQQSTKFIQNEVQHLRDVHVLFVYFYLFGLIAIILLFKFFRFRVLSRKFLITSTVSLFLACLVMGIFFSTFFELFHKLLFPQGNFAFPEDSVLIQTFPPIFWFLQFAELVSGVLISLVLQFKGADSRDC